MASHHSSIEALNGLRFVAAAHVLLFHTLSFDSLPSWLAGILSRGPISVSLFFILSGFVLAYRYDNGSLSPSIDPGRYGLARFARIYPVYFLSLLVSLPYVAVRLYRELSGDVVTMFSKLIQVFTPQVLLIHAWYPATAPGTNAAAWSLSVEAFFYLIFPVICGSAIYRSVVRYPVPWMSGMWLLLAIPIIAYLGSPTVYEGVHDKLIYANPVFRLPEFILGIVLGSLFVRRKQCTSNSLFLHTKGRFTPSLIFVCMIVLMALTSQIHGLFVRLMLVPLFAVLIYGLAFQAGFLSRLLSGHVITRLGGASYALYIMHMPLYLVILSLNDRTLGLDARSWVFKSLYLVLVVIISVVIYFYFEEPMRRYIKSRLSRSVPAYAGSK